MRREKLISRSRHGGEVKRLRQCRTPGTGSPRWSNYGISIPEDFRLYLLTTAPSGYYMDEFSTTWWTLDDIKNIPDECGESAHGDPVVVAEEGRYLVFADHLIWCYAWAICCADGDDRGKIALIGDGDHFVADSFAHFVELQLNEDPAIHPGAVAKKSGTFDDASLLTKLTVSDYSDEIDAPNCARGHAARCAPFRPALLDLSIPCLFAGESYGRRKPIRLDSIQNSE